MTTKYTWIPIYQELAKVLSGWQNRQKDLISFLEGLRSKDYIITPLMDKDENGERFLINEMDPFTFFGVFNRGIRMDQRIAILLEMKKYFGLQSSPPDDFNGIPVLNNLSSWFIPYKVSRDIGDVGRLWRVFQLALGNDPLHNAEFLQAFDDALTVQQTNINLTMGLFWIRPETFLNLDQTNRSFLDITLPPSGLTAKFYTDTMQSVSQKWSSFPELSSDAWSAIKTIRPYTPESGTMSSSEAINYWLVGAYWDDRDPADQTKRFLDEGIWENGSRERFFDDVKSMRVNDKIAIKAAFTQRKDLPFDNHNKTVSRMAIKAIGTIVANRGNGRVIEVEWDKHFKEKNWYFYTSRSTLWRLKTEDSYKYKDYVVKLRDFVWYGKEQDYDWFLKQWWESEKPMEPSKILDEPIINTRAYSIEDVIASGVFLEESEIKEVLDRLFAKKAMILQGAPGVGKNFIAKKIAYALMEEENNDRIEMVQFHQSYSYDDFIRGIRPDPKQPGSFGIQDGIFYDFCQKAINDPEQEYVFIIDEINRGNLSQIFGELLMLIESDKRGPKNAVPLVYRREDEPKFFIPSNLFMIGLMNVADRSLAMVDYALRRRFAFITLKPQYENKIFHKWLSDRSMNANLIQLIVGRMSMLNKSIREDPLLGENYQIGHSYFCPKGDNFTELDQEWYKRIVRTEIVPMLKEYWYDNPKKVDDAERNLLA